MADFNKVISDFIDRAATTAADVNKVIVDTFIVGGKGVQQVASDTNKGINTAVSNVEHAAENAGNIAKYGAIAAGAVALLLMFGGNRR